MNKYECFTLSGKKFTILAPSHEEAGILAERESGEIVGTVNFLSRVLD